MLRLRERLADAADLSAEAIRLGRLLVALLPEAEPVPEAVGLLALMLLQDSRRTARTSPEGELIPLEEQHRALWDRQQIAEGTALVRRALSSDRIGPYTIQAAIGAVHAQAPSVAATDWSQIVGLYDLLMRVVPSPVIELNRAVAVAMRDGPEAGLVLVDDLMGLVLPEPTKTPPGLVLPFSWMRVRGSRAYVSGHGPLNPDSSIADPLGKVGAEVSEEQGYEAARLTALAMLTSLKRELGDLDRVSAWLRVFGMVNSAPDFSRQPNVINGFSNLILELYGQEAGDHARSAVGMAGLPLGMPVEIEAEVEILGG